MDIKEAAEIIKRYNQPAERMKKIRDEEVNIILDDKNIPASFVFDALHDLSFVELESILSVLLDEIHAKPQHAAVKLRTLIIERLKLMGEL